MAMTIGILTLILKMRMKVLIYFLLILPHLLPFCALVHQSNLYIQLYHFPQHPCLQMASSRRCSEGSATRWPTGISKPHIGNTPSHQT